MGSAGCNLQATQLLQSLPERHFYVVTAFLAVASCSLGAPYLLFSIFTAFVGLWPSSLVMRWSALDDTLLSPASVHKHMCASSSILTAANAWSTIKVYKVQGLHTPQRCAPLIQTVGMTFHHSSILFNTCSRMAVAMLCMCMRPHSVYARQHKRARWHVCADAEGAHGQECHNMQSAGRPSVGAPSFNCKNDPKPKKRSDVSAFMPLPPKSRDA